MKKEPTLFQNLLIRLRENIFPTLIKGMNDMGYHYIHIGLNPAFSMCFFNYKGIEFPFLENDLMEHGVDANGNPNKIVVFNLRCDGQISIGNRLVIALDGTTRISQEVVIFKHFSELFEKEVPLENAFLYQLSKDLTAKAKEVESEAEILRKLIQDMDSVIPKITRTVLMEKVDFNK